MELLLAALAVFHKILYGTGLDLFYVLGAAAFLWYLIGKNKAFKLIFILSGITLIYSAAVQVLSGSYDFKAASLFAAHTILNISLMVWTCRNVGKIRLKFFLYAVAVLLGLSTIAAFVFKNSFLWRAQEYESGLGPLRLRLFYPEPAYLSYVCAILIVLTVYHLISTSFSLKVAGSGLVFLAVMILSYGMGGMITCAVAIPVLLMIYVISNRNSILDDPLKKATWATIGVILLVIVVGIISLSPVYGMRIIPLLSGQDNGFVYTFKRPFSWFVRIMDMTGWKGAGIGQLVGSDIGNSLGIVLEFKNSFLRVMSEGGILGIILIFGIVMALLIQCLLYGNELAVALFIFSMLMQFSTGNFEDPFHWIVYGIILGECAKVKLEKKKEQVTLSSSNDNLLSQQGYAVIGGDKTPDENRGDSSSSIKVCLVGSSGGHLTHLYMLKPFWENKDRFWVTFDKEDARSLLENERMIPCYYPTNRSIKGLIINTVLAFRVLKKERPDLVISAGAAVAVPFFYVGKLYGAKCIYIEVFDRIDKPTMSGKLVYPVTDRFIVEWEEMKKVYPGAINLGSVF
ncbi:PssD/Cps14F family polysaccharide biosynthesis glycosyltransferase [Butyrivibrio sp. XB500-5]|uniref:PssD/Cps14F family polysaccharide biosynthesis glycosyltransferase n=1 Tax=Butyrivibrio sp. XB500-5 TaxID=2364880 RepID=UPI00268882AC